VSAGQTIWVTSGATRYAAVCEACVGDRRDRPGGWGYEQSAVVEGSLRPEADVGFATCRRGHRLRVRRTARTGGQVERSGARLTRLLRELAEHAVAEG
jgi:hypothetical protein